MQRCDALVIGGGFYGCKIALHLKSMGLRSVKLAEQERTILQRASMNNQARVHNGYHYPRSLVTAQASRRHFNRFIDDHRYAIDSGATALYAIAMGSQVSPAQFERFCQYLDAPCRSLPRQRWHLFDPSMIQEAYEVDEPVFDADKIAATLLVEMRQRDVDVRLSTVARIEPAKSERAVVRLNHDLTEVGLVINCTYAWLDTLGVTIKAPLRREWAEMALVVPPPIISDANLTVMDGPFFSCMRFPTLGLHTLSHVRYTPIAAWLDRSGTPCTPTKSSGYGASTNAQAMARDAARYVPSLRNAEIKGSLYEVKAVLQQSDRNDDRPILFESATDFSNVISILGAKIDNVYDILEMINPTFVAKMLA